MTLQQRKARKFAQDLEIWDNFKEVTFNRLKSGEITEKEYHALLKNKAEELDL